MAGRTRSVLRGVREALARARKQGGAEYKYEIDLDERGEFRAHVEDERGQVVYSVDGGQIFEDGWMRHGRDVAGLTEYLIDLGIIPKGSEIHDASLTQAEYAGVGSFVGSDLRVHTDRERWDFPKRGVKGVRKQPIEGQEEYEAGLMSEITDYLERMGPQPTANIIDQVGEPAGEVWPVIDRLEREGEIKSAGEDMWERVNRPDWKGDAVKREGLSRWVAKRLAGRARKQSGEWEPWVVDQPALSWFVMFREPPDPNDEDEEAGRASNQVVDTILTQMNAMFGTDAHSNEVVAWEPEHPRGVSEYGWHLEVGFPGMTRKDEPAVRAIGENALRSVPSNLITEWRYEGPKNLSKRGSDDLDIFEQVGNLAISLGGILDRGGPLIDEIRRSGYEESAVMVQKAMNMVAGATELLHQAPFE